jgi:phosphonoacetaldehyde hydrolase
MPKIRAVIFDWAGTVVDFGCQAPVVAIEELFRRHGLPLEGGEARHAMGLLKRDQLREILGLPRVAEAWRQLHGDADRLDELFAEFIPLQLEIVERHSAVIAGVPDIVERLRGLGFKIGSTTGYTRPMLAPVIARAAREGYSPDFSITPDEAGSGRPAPWMIFANMRAFDVYPPAAIVKVGDTPSDMQEARNAGALAVGVIASSNETAAWGSVEARRRLLAAGADYLIETLEELPAAIEQLESLDR